MLLIYKKCKGALAEWSKALVLGTSQKWRGFEPRRHHFFIKFFKIQN